MADFLDLTGLRFGRLVVINLAGKEPRTKWLCQCDCGKQKIVVGNNLRTGGSKSCGCVSKEKISIKTRERSTTHGHATRGNWSPEYRSWTSMWARCTYPYVNSFERYGGRGIKVCERWESFELFLQDMGLKPTNSHTLDRYPNPDGHYEPSNCRWATPKEQRANRGT